MEKECPDTFKDWKKCINEFEFDCFKDTIAYSKSFSEGENCYDGNDDHLKCDRLDCLKRNTESSEYYEFYECIQSIC